MPETAERLLRRISKAGAPTLIRLLAEHGGAPVPRQDGLEAEAAVLRDWDVMLERPDSWQLPLDLAVGMVGAVRRERGFAATLIARLDDQALRGLTDELGVTVGGSRAYQVVRALWAMPAQGPTDDRARAAAARLAELCPLDVDRLGPVAVVPETAGSLWSLVYEGAPHEVTHRELAEQLGHAFIAEPVEGLRPGAVSLEPVEVPEAELVSALLTFPSRRALDEALSVSWFASLTARRLGERRIAVLPGVDRVRLREALLRLGYEDVDRGERDRADREGGHAG